MDARIAARPANRAVGIWLLACCAMIAAMVVIGGITRLTASGLRDVPWVSPYRLTAHLGLAVAIYAGALWLALSLLRPPAPPVSQGLRRGAWLITALVFTTLLAGGFVAGTDAGLIYNTFP